MSKNILPIMLFSPFLIIVFLGGVLFLTHHPLILNILGWIAIISVLLSAGFVLLKLSGFSKISKLKNPTVNSYSTLTLGGVTGLWAVVATMVIGIYVVLDTPQFIGDVSKFIETFEKNCPWWPR